MQTKKQIRDKHTKNKTRLTQAMQRTYPWFVPSVLAPRTVLKKGLEHVGIQWNPKHNSDKAMTEEFCAHYGPSPLDVASVWYDLVHASIPEAKLDEKEHSEQGFRMFMSAHYFLWNHQRNARNLGSRFKICERYAWGEHLWRWVSKIQALKAAKIKWDPKIRRSQQRNLHCICRRNRLLPHLRSKASHDAYRPEALVPQVQWSWFEA